MTDEKGYIRFRCEWEPADPPASPLADELRACRDRLHRLGLVGVYPNGIGYGNLSVRTGDLVAVTPSGVPYEQLDAAAICLVGLDGRQVEGLTHGASRDEALRIVRPGAARRRRVVDSGASSTAAKVGAA